MSRAAAFANAAILITASALVAWVSPTDPGASYGLVRGAPAVQSLGAMAFGPENILFIGDSQGAALHAVRIEDSDRPSAAPINVADIDAKVAQLLGTETDQVIINDMAVHPTSGNVYLTVTRGRGAGGQPALIKVTRAADQPLELVALDDVLYATTTIADAPASDPAARRNPRTLTVTDIAFADGEVFVAGLSNEEFSSAFRRVPFPFSEAIATTTLEIYHVSHGRNETNAPVMTFMPKRIQDSMYILAAYTCTPLVAFGIDDLADGQHVFGRTVAELGASNQPLDMISFTYDGADQIVIANSRHPLMKVSTSDIVGAPALTDPTEEIGIPRVATERTGITQLADLNAEHVIVIQPGANGLDLRSIAKSAL